MNTGCNSFVTGAQIAAARNLRRPAQPGWAPAIMLFGLVVVLFPDGRLPSPRWRWPARGYVAAGLLWIAGALVLTVRAARGGPAVQPGPLRRG